MKKARSLREALIKAVPQLETNPEMMRIFADGRAARLSD